MGRLQRLKKLNLDLCTGTEPPGDFEKLTCLTSLSIRGDWKIGHIERLTSSFGVFTALKSLKVWSNPAIEVLPASLEILKSLRHLEIWGWDALLRVEGWPQGLDCLYVWNCSGLIDVPSLAGMSSLTFLSFMFCKSLTHIQGLEYVTALEEIHLSGCTSLVDCGLLVMHNRALRKCCLSGSKVAVAYDNRWLEREPSSQLLVYSDSAIGYLPNGMAREVVRVDGTWEKVMEVTISSEAECVALISCFVAKFIDLVEFRIMRDGMLVSRTTTAVAYRECVQVILWTLRRGHLTVRSLQLGDHICVYVIPVVENGFVLEGAICVVHAEDEGAEDEHLILQVNSELLGRRQSQDLATKFGQLVLRDHCSHISVSHTLSL